MHPNTADFEAILWSVVELLCITLLKKAASPSLNDYQFPIGYEWDCVPNALFHDEMFFDLSLHRSCSYFHSHFEFICVVSLISLDHVVPLLLSATSG